MFSKCHAPPGYLLKALMRRGEICRMCLLQCLSYYTGQSFQLFRVQCNPLNPLNSMGLYDLRKISPGLHEASPKAILAVNLSCTPSEGLVFFRHFHTPSEGVRDATLATGTRRAILNEFTSGCNLFCNRLKISGLQMLLHIWLLSKGGGCAARFVTI